MGYKNLSTSRGDGNLFTIKLVMVTVAGIRTYPPREGTETKSRSQCGLHLEK